MTTPRKRSPQPPKKLAPPMPSSQEQPLTPPQPEPTGKIFLGEEDKRLLKKFNQHIVNKLGLGGNRSVKM
jgi:hypothetical protein